MTSTFMTAHVTSRPMATDADFWRMRQLLVDTVPITPIGFNWDMRRLDGQRFYNADLEANRLLRRSVQLWEEDGRLVAFVLAEGGDEAHLQVHPDYRFLEEEIVAWAVATPGGPGADSRRHLHINAMDYDALRQQVLARHGFEPMPYGGMIRHLRLGRQPLPTPVVASGYTLRTADPADPADCQGIADILNAAFERDFHNGLEYQHFAELAPSYLRDLDLVAVAPDGSFAAYVGIPYDAQNRRGVYEPVCTHPAHQRKGLARALMTEGLHRLRALGAVDAIVGTGDMVPANSLYTAMGFTEAYREVAWRKILEARI